MEGEKLEYPPTISPKDPHFFARLLWDSQRKAQSQWSSSKLSNLLRGTRNDWLYTRKYSSWRSDLPIQEFCAVAVVRQNKDTHRYEIVGKAVTFNPSAMESFRCQALNTKVKCRDVSERPILFHLTIPTLQLLTAPELPLSTLVNLDMFF
jgi:hypothetical protein